MIIPSGIRSVLSGDRPTTRSGSLRISSAPNFSIHGPDDNSTEFFGETMKRFGVLRILPSIFSRLNERGVAVIGLNVDAMERDIYGDPFVINEDFLYTPNGGRSLRPLSDIMMMVSRGEASVIDDDIEGGDDIIRRWRDEPLNGVNLGVYTISIPAMYAWGGSSVSASFSHQKQAVEGWMDHLCLASSLARSLVSNNMGTIAGEIPTVSPKVRWSC